MEAIYACASSALSTFDYSISFSSLTFLSLVSFPVLSNSGPIKVGEISSLLLTIESYKASNRAEKLKGILEGGPQLYTNNTTAQGIVITLGHIGYCTGST